MSQEKVVYEVNSVPEVVASGILIGKFWSVIRGDFALAAMPMRVPSDVDFEAYREQAQKALGSLGGDVKSGELFAYGGKRYFVVRLTHSNRSKTPRAPKVFELREFNE